MMYLRFLSLFKTAEIVKASNLNLLKHKISDPALDPDTVIELSRTLRLGRSSIFP